MSACDSIDWNMTLVVVRDGKPDETLLNFVDVDIIFGLISGDVHYGGRKVSELHGLCVPLGRNASQMTFRFNLPGVELFLIGIAFEDPRGNVKFDGVFRAFEPRTGVSTKPVAAFPDVGETGTGNGNQAQNPDKPPLT
jgi:hypothetical protein